MARNDITLINGRLKGITARKAIFVIEYLKDRAPRRAAEAAGFAPEQGYKFLEDPRIVQAIGVIIEDQIEDACIDAEWLLYELVDNHRIARQTGNLAASNSALKTLAQHVSIDALAKQKIEVDVVTDKELLQRLQDGRKRMNTIEHIEEVSFID
jgi:phage terminase small subunit